MVWKYCRSVWPKTVLKHSFNRVSEIPASSAKNFMPGIFYENRNQVFFWFKTLILSRLLTLKWFSLIASHSIFKRKKEMNLEKPELQTTFSRLIINRLKVVNQAGFSTIRRGFQIIKNNSTRELSGSLLLVSFQRGDSHDNLYKQRQTCLNFHSIMCWLPALY